MVNGTTLHFQCSTFSFSRSFKDCLLPPSSLSFYLPPLHPFFPFPLPREREMQWVSCASKYMLIQGAKEELELLELQHPNKFESMKRELRTFISELESQHLVLDTPCPSAATQESSSREKRKRGSIPIPVVEASDVSCMKMKRRCRTDAVLERAQLCLHKIQHLKTTFL